MPKQFDPHNDISDLSGKVILVTGGNAGIGAATVRALAEHHPARLYLCARTAKTAEALVSSIHETSPKANITILPLDLSSFDSVQQCANEFNRQSDRLDVLFLNAGIASVAPALSKEGYELQFGVNHLGHALLTQLLLPKMLQTKQQHSDADLRIVVTSSIGGHIFIPKDGLDLSQMSKADPFSHGMVRYGHSKLANILFARKLAQLYPDILTTSAHPGTVKSEIFGRANGAKILGFFLAPIVWATGVTTEEGAKTQLWCATAPRGDKDGPETGVFYEPIGKRTDRSAHAKSQELTDELWEWTSTELERHGAAGWPKA